MWSTCRYNNKKLITLHNFTNTTSEEAHFNHFGYIKLIQLPNTFFRNTFFRNGYQFKITIKTIVRKKKIMLPSMINYCIDFTPSLKFSLPVGNSWKWSNNQERPSNTIPLWEKKTIPWVLPDPEQPSIKSFFILQIKFSIFSSF